VRHFETGAAALREGVKGGGTKATLQAFFPSFSKSPPVFLQTFPKKALAVLWDFKGLQGPRAEKPSPNLFAPSASF
jgi:hypothetical protein